MYNKKKYYARNVNFITLNMKLQNNKYLTTGKQTINMWVFYNTYRQKKKN